MSTVVIKPTGPLSSGEFPVTDPDRLEDVELKQERVAELLERLKLDALLLERPGNFSWFTSGGDSTRAGSTEPCAALFLTAEARVVVCQNADTAAIFDRQIPGLGFQLKAGPLYLPREGLIANLCRGRKVGSDSGFPGTMFVPRDIHLLRYPLTTREIHNARLLGRNVVHAVEATARAMKPGRAEAEVAGELAHRLIKHAMQPVELQVSGDGRGKVYPRLPYTEDAQVKKWGTITAFAKRWGLTVGVSRTIRFVDLDDTLVEQFKHASMLSATGCYFAQPGRLMGEVAERVLRIYEKTGSPEEWRAAPLGGIWGYDSLEGGILPKSPQPIPDSCVMTLHPRLGAMQACDSILVQPEAFELLTPVENWPTFEVQVKGTGIKRPAILAL